MRCMKIEKVWFTETVAVSRLTEILLSRFIQIYSQMSRLFNELFHPKFSEKLGTTVVSHFP